MLDDKTWDGVTSLLDGYVKVRDDDIVVMAYTPDSREPAAWVFVALESRGVDTRRVCMSPLRDDDFLDNFTSVLPSPAALPGRLVVLTFERDTMSHNSLIRSALSEFDKTRCMVFRAISTCPSLFSEALAVSPEELSARNTTLLTRCMAATKLRIKTVGGTDLRVTLDSRRYRWISNRGMWRPGRFVMLPAGEVATFPESIEGVLVADFAYNVNAISDRDARLHDHPVTVWIEDGRAVRFECEKEENRRFLDQCFRTHCAHNVGELGFGTNFGVTESIPLNSHINERRLGVHLGFGDHNQNIGVVDYECPIHVDLIANGGMVWFDDDPMPLDLENISPSSEPHPNRYFEEDLKSPEDKYSELDDLDIDDCCGILKRDGLQLFQPSSLHGSA